MNALDTSHSVEELLKSLPPIDIDAFPETQEGLALYLNTLRGDKYVKRSAHIIDSAFVDMSTAMHALTILSHCSPHEFCMDDALPHLENIAKILQLNVERPKVTETIDEARADTHYRMTSLDPSQDALIHEWDIPDHVVRAFC